MAAASPVMSRSFSSRLTLMIIIFVSVPYNDPKLSEAGSNVLLPQGRQQCACASETLNFTCTFVGSGVTLWDGTALNCTNNAHEIVILRDNNTYRCNGGQITGRNLGVENNSYTSLLSVSTTAALNNKSIRCSKGINVSIGERILIVISAGYDEPPANLALRDVQSGTLVFSWSRVDPTNCSRETYSITHDGCGTCTVGSNYSATCTDIQASVNPTQCNFSVNSMICGFSGTPSNSTVVNLMVPDATRIIREVLPIYASDTQLLTKVAASVTISQSPFFFTDDLPGPITQYRFVFSPGDMTVSTNQSGCNSGDACEYEAEVPTSVCSTDISVTISAANRLGQGPPSQPYLFGCTNQFVRVEYDSAASIVTCVFLNTGSQNSNVTCSIRYGACKEEFSKGAQGSTTTEFPDQVVIQNIRPGGSDCYAVRASNDTYAVIVEGSFNTGSRSRSNTAGIVAGVVVPLALFIAIGIILSVTICNRKRCATLRSDQGNSDGTVSNHASESVPRPERTLFQTTLLEDFGGFA